MKKLLTLVALAAMSGCAHDPADPYSVSQFKCGTYMCDVYQVPPMEGELNDGKVQVMIEKIQPGAGPKDFYLLVKVKNITGEEQVFDPGEIELTDTTSGLSFFHITKDKSTVTLPMGFNVMMPTKLRAGQMISGQMWFPTEMQQARVKNIKVLYHGIEKVLPPPAPPPAAPAK